MCTRLLFKEEKPPAHGRDDNMIWARGSCRIKETSNWAWAGPEVPNDYVLKDTLPPQNVPHTPLPQTQDEKIFKNQNILLLQLSRFVPYSKFFPSVRYLFSHFSWPGTASILKRSQIHRLFLIWDTFTGLWYGNDIAGGHDAATASRDIFIEDDLWGNFHINVVLLGSTAKPWYHWG